MVIKTLTVTTTPQLVPVQANPTTGLDLKTPSGQPAVYFGIDNTVTGPSGANQGFPVNPNDREFVPADHFNAGGSVYVVADRAPTGAAPVISCKSQ